MKISFLNADALTDGILCLAEDLKIEISDAAPAELTVTVEESAERVVRVTLEGERATVTYGDGKARFFRGLSMLLYHFRRGARDLSIEERPLFVSNGAMVGTDGEKKTARRSFAAAFFGMSI